MNFDEELTLSLAPSNQKKNTPPKVQSSHTYNPEKLRLSGSQSLFRYLLAQQFQADPELDPHLFFGAFASLGKFKPLNDAIYIHKSEINILPKMDFKTLADCSLSFTESKKRQQVFIISSNLYPDLNELLTMLHFAYNKHLPVLFLFTYDPDFRQKNSESTIKQIEASLALLQSYCGFASSITDPSNLPMQVDQAIHQLITAPSPCALILSEKMLTSFHDFEPKLFHPKLHQITPPSVDPKDLTYLNQALQEAKRPVVICGGGVHSTCFGPLSQFIKSFKLPICETFSGKGAMAWNYSYHLGTLLKNSPSLAKKVVSEADLVICVGSYLDDYEKEKLLASPGQKLIFINLFSHSFSEKFKKEKKLHLIQADLGDFLKQLDKIKQVPAPLVDYLAQISIQLDDVRSSYVKATFNTGEVPTIPEVVATLNRSIKTKDMTIYCSEDSSEDVFEFWRCTHHRGYPLIQDDRSMTFQLHKGLGYQLANPTSKIYLIMTANDLPRIQNLLLRYQALSLQANLIVLDHPSTEAAGSLMRPDLKPYLKSMGFPLEHCHSLQDFEAKLKLSQKRYEPSFFLIRTQILNKDPNLHLWQPSFANRMGLKERKTVSYKSEEQAWHVRFPWENKKEEQAPEKRSHALSSSEKN